LNEYLGACPLGV